MMAGMEWERISTQELARRLVERGESSQPVNLGRSAKAMAAFNMRALREHRKSLFLRIARRIAGAGIFTAAVFALWTWL